MQLSHILIRHQQLIWVDNVFNAKTTSSGLKWVLASLFIESIMLSLLIWSNLEQLHTSLSAQTQTRLNESSALLQSALSAPLVQMDYATAKAIMNETQQVEGIVYLVVLDRQSRRLISVGWDEQTPLPRVETEAFNPNALSDARFDTRIPLSLGETPLGTLAIGLSTQFYLQAREDALIRSIGIALFELLFSALLLLSLNYWFGKKFMQLTQQAKTIAQGNYQQKLSTSEHHEYDQLVMAFNQMSDAISLKIEQLESAYDEQKRLNKKVMYLANNDSLTALPNAYALDSHLNLMVNTKQDTSILLLDLDNFKQINDTIGHHIGDQLIKSFAALLQRLVPEKSFIARLQGDEFAIVLPETESKRLSALASSLCLQISNHHFHAGSNQLKLGISIGYSRFPNEAPDARSLMNQADIAMYQAKAAGKNIYRAYTPNMD